MTGAKQLHGGHRLVEDILAASAQARPGLSCATLVGSLSSLAGHDRFNCYGSELAVTYMNVARPCWSWYRARLANRRGVVRAERLRLRDEHVRLQDDQTGLVAGCARYILAAAGNRLAHSRNRLANKSSHARAMRIVPFAARPVAVVALMAIMETPLTAQPAGVVDRRPSLCKRSEVAIFSCRVGSKIVSLCASPDLSETTGTMGYRFGRKGAIELEHPATSAHPRTAFRAGVDPSERGDFVRFSKGDHTYTVYARVGSQDRREEDGLLITRGQKVLRNLKCADFAMGDTAWQLMYRAKIPADPSHAISPR